MFTTPFLCWSQMLLFVCATFAHPLHLSPLFECRDQCVAVHQHSLSGCCGHSPSLGTGQRATVGPSATQVDPLDASGDCNICQFHQLGKQARCLNESSNEIDSVRFIFYSVKRENLGHQSSWHARGPPGFIRISSMPNFV